MSDTASPLWTAEQHGWLAALGHAVYVQGAVPEPTSAAPELNPAVDAAPARVSAPKPAPERQPRERAVPPPAPVVARESPPPRARPKAMRIPGPLDMALIRAAKINPNLPEMAEVMAGWPDSALLRKDPAAKRALWPQLRKLRKAARQ